MKKMSSFFYSNSDNRAPLSLQHKYKRESKIENNEFLAEKNRDSFYPGLIRQKFKGNFQGGHL